MADVKWIKLHTGMFDNSKIKYIRTLPEGNNIVLIWVMLLAKAGKCNSNGFIFLTENIPYTPKMLSAEFDFDISIIELALATFNKLGMIHLEEQKIMITGWNEHQNIEGLERIRQQTRKRVADYRKKQKFLSCNVTSNVTVTHCNATDIDKEGEGERDSINDTIPYASIIEYLNEKAGTHYRQAIPKTQTVIRARFGEGFSEEDFRTVIDKKCKEWLGTEWEKFLRPETLFGTKFESYLQANTPQNPGTPSSFDTDDFFEAAVRKSYG